MSFAPGMIALRPGEGRRVEAMSNIRINKAVGADTRGAPGRWWNCTSPVLVRRCTGTIVRTRRSTCWKAARGSGWAMRSSRLRRGASFSDPGSPTTFAGQPGGDLELLVLIAPAGFEQMFDEIAQLSEDEQQDPSVLGGMAARYGVQTLGPPPL